MFVGCKEGAGGCNKERPRWERGGTGVFSKTLQIWDNPQAGHAARPLAGTRAAGPRRAGYGGPPTPPPPLPPRSPSQPGATPTCSRGPRGAALTPLHMGPAVAPRAMPTWPGGARGVAAAGALRRARGSPKSYRAGAFAATLLPVLHPLLIADIYLIIEQAAGPCRVTSSLLAAARAQGPASCRPPRPAAAPYERSGILYFFIYYFLRGGGCCWCQPPPHHLLPPPPMPAPWARHAERSPSLQISSPRRAWAGSGPTLGHWQWGGGQGTGFVVCMCVPPLLNPAPCPRLGIAGTARATGGVGAAGGCRGQGLARAGRGWAELVLSG